VESVAAVISERETALGAFISRLVAEIEPLHLELNQESWLGSVTGKAEHEERSARLDARIRTIFAQSEPYRYLLGVRDSGGVQDPTLARQLELLIHAYRAQQMPAETIERMVQIEKTLESRFNNFRAEFGGRRVGDNEIRQLLEHSNDNAERRAAWEASKQIGAEVVDDLRELVRVRNAAARDQGFENFYTMTLELDELREDELFAVLDELDLGTRDAFTAYRRKLDAQLAVRFGIAPADIRPWHMRDPFFQEAPPSSVNLNPYFADKSLEDLMVSFFGAVGLDIRDLIERADLYEKPGKSQHAFCLHVDRAGDIRVLCNLRPNEHWMGVLLHEFGHAAYDKYIDPALPWLLRGPAHTLTTEASAMLFGRLSKNAAWLNRYAGMPAEEARVAGTACARAIREQLLVQARWCLVMCHMERALYRDPEQDLDTLWWDLVERFQMLRRPDGRHAPDWASKLHLSLAPVYYHNYMLGEIMASQLQRHILEHVLGGGEAWPRFVTSGAVGEYLVRDLYRSGKSMDWRGTLKQATGSSLDTSAFIAELTAAD
jgi:peptidyl-dipeptidase A